MTALPLNASLPAGPARSNSQPDAAAHGVSQSSPFPALFGDMVGADGRSDAAPLKSDAKPLTQSAAKPLTQSAATPLKKGAATPSQPDMAPVQIELVPTDLIQTNIAAAGGAPGSADPATAELPATAPADTAPVPDTLPGGPSTITAEQIGRPAGRYQLPAGNPFTTVKPAPGQFDVASPSKPVSLNKRTTVGSQTGGEAELPGATNAELQAKMNLPGLPVGSTPAPLLIEPHPTDANKGEFNTGEPRQPALPLRAGIAIDPSVHVSTGNVSETAGLAFAARLVPIAATAQQTAVEAPQLPRAIPDAPARPSAALNTAPGAGEPAEKGVTAPMTPYGGVADHAGDNQPTAEQDRNGGLPDHSRKSDEPQAASDELPQTAAGRVIAHTEYAPEPRVNTPGQTASSSTAEPAQAKEAPGLPSGSETAKAPGAARDIRLEIGGGDHRVEVRLMERGGEVHVAVRTPDTHLASTLREDLSALSSRLNESGFRTETWHPGGAGSSEWHRQAEPSAGGTPQDPDNQQGQNGRERQPGDRQPQQQQVSEQQLNQKQKGKDFEWFMSTLR